VRVLITGGAGFIGSHLSDALVARGDKVTILDNLSTGSQKNIAHLEGKVTVINGDIRNKELVEDLVEKNDLVLHMAAAVGVDNILNNPIESISINYQGSEIVLNSANKYDKRILIASTSEIYGKNSNQPLSENDDRVIGMPQNVRWSYSDAKALEEATAHTLFMQNKLRVTTVRFFNTVGPRQSHSYGMVIPRFVKSAFENESIQVFGTGNQTRVFCHVLDAVDAVIELANLEKSIGEVFNIGGEGEISILDLAKKVIHDCNSQSKIELIAYELAYPYGFEDMLRRVPNISKIKSFINWTPKRDLTQIIKDVKNSLN